MHTHTYIHIHIRAQPAASVFADVYVGVKTHLCSVHTCPCTSVQNTCSKVACNTHCKKMHIYIYLHTYAYAYICTWIHMRMHDIVHALKNWYWDPQSMHKYAYAYTYTCVLTHTYTHAYTHAYTCICTCPHTYTQTHIYTHAYEMYICTHTNTPGTTVRQRPRKELMQTQEVLHVSFVRRHQSHLAPPMVGLNRIYFLRHKYPCIPHPLFPTYPRTVRWPRILGGRDFTVPHWSTQQSAPLWRSSAQLHNGPLRSCRKIGGNAAVQ